MILQAREGAVKFYQSLGYKVIEKTYLLFGQIQHYKMEKRY
jgi:predicted GNAT family N-acyltransferase